jgi:hypothetical protein
MTIRSRYSGVSYNDISGASGVISTSKLTGEMAWRA